MPVASAADPCAQCNGETCDVVQRNSAAASVKSAVSRPCVNQSKTRAAETRSGRLRPGHHQRLDESALGERERLFHARQRRGGIAEHSWHIAKIDTIDLAAASRLMPHDPFSTDPSRSCSSKKRVMAAWLQVGTLYSAELESRA
jgi:hypothetical protein